MAAEKWTCTNCGTLTSTDEPRCRSCYHERKAQRAKSAPPPRPAAAEGGSGGARNAADAPPPDGDQEHEEARRRLARLKTEASPGVDRDAERKRQLQWTGGALVVIVVVAYLLFS